MIRMRIHKTLSQRYMYTPGPPQPLTYGLQTPSIRRRSA